MVSDSTVSPVVWHPRPPRARGDDSARRSQINGLERISELLEDDPQLARRFHEVAAYQRRIRVSEYHLTNACNIRCKGCWFFEGGLDRHTRDETNLDEIEAFVVRETKQRRINSALVIGGEPVLFPRRLAIFAKHMRHLSICSNGLKKLPVEGFEKVGVGVSVWGGGPADDEMRAIKPNGARFEGLFDTALENYRNDRRVTFVYAVTEGSLEHIEPTVRRIRDNGNPLIFNFYSDYTSEEPIAVARQQELMAELLRVRELYPRTVISHPYYIRAMVTGRSHWGEFGYDSCPSISRDHPAHGERLANGNPVLPLFNSFAADMKSVTFCCTSGRCDGCRDSQALGSWLLVNMTRFADDLAQLRTWVELAESWWAQFSWSPYHCHATEESISTTPCEEAL
ncbi:MAG TPA: radical SAM protein [Ramlibacter sp.]|uniref:radical SAM protein n=1 Tax=Ramlibacter sp. TaxID=1917967 RepID=UPI002D175B3F|nr:radical SAM protein [Ramlibacter sp.]HVZ45010.1 radical SAM protein [Ramlibacter sp.]